MKDVDVYDIPKITLDKTPRPDQLKLVEFTKDCVMSNKKYIMIDAPTGIGKSYFVVMVMDWFKKNYNMAAQFDILTNSKILQEQYTRDFDFMQSLWGKASYTCDRHNTDCGTGMEWCKIQNSKCDNCPYAIAKARFEMADAAITNFHLFLTYKMFMPMAWKRSSQVLIIDEAHDFESVVCDFISTNISKPMLKRNGFTDEEIIRALNVFGQYPEDLTAADFVRLVSEDFLNIVKSVLNRLAREAEEGNIQSVQHGQALMNNFLKWENLSKEYEKMPDNWIVEIEYVNKRNKDGVVTDSYYEFAAQPVWADPYLDEKVWSKYDYVLFMSGTILDKNMFCQMNGINIESSDYISLDSPFPVENRPIYYFHKTGKQTYKTKEIVWEKQKDVLGKVLKKHRNDKGIIHTANYEIQGWVSKAFDNDRILAHDSNNRNEMLQQHYNTDRPTILVSPSMITGVDLAEDYGRFSVILKCPYPNLGSKKIKKRMDGRSEWYGLTTVRALMQQYGRVYRSNVDYAKSYILDSCFGDILKYNTKYFPKWFTDAIIYVD